MKSELIPLISDLATQNKELSDISVELGKKLVAAYSQKTELGNLIYSMEVKSRILEEKLLIAREPYVPRTLAYSQYNTSVYGTDPTAFRAKIELSCTKNAPFNAIKYLNSMEGNLKWITGLREEYPNVMFYVYEKGSSYSLGFKDYKFNVADKVYIIYNAKTEMDINHLKMLHGCINTFVISEERVHMNLCVGQNQYNQLPVYLRPNSSYYPDPISISQYNTLPSRKESLVNTFHGLFNSRPIRRVY